MLSRHERARRSVSAIDQVAPLSNTGRVSSITAQSGALDAQMVICGLPCEGSSSVPARMITRLGRTSDALVMGVPQSGQNPRCIGFPESATDAISVNLPVISTDDRSKTMLIVALPAAQYWQSRHQQVRTSCGAADAVYLTCPQRHLPVIVMFSAFFVSTVVAVPLGDGPHGPPEVQRGSVSVGHFHRS